MLRSINYLGLSTLAKRQGAHVNTQIKVYIRLLVLMICGAERIVVELNTRTEVLYSNS